MSRPSPSMEILTAMLIPANRRLLFPIMEWRALFRACSGKDAVEIITTHFIQWLEVCFYHIHWFRKYHTTCQWVNQTDCHRHSALHGKHHTCCSAAAALLVKARIVGNLAQKNMHSGIENVLLTFFLQGPFPPGTASQSLLMASLINKMKKGQKSKGNTGHHSDMFMISTSCGFMMSSMH